MGLIEIFLKILTDNDKERKGMTTKDISKIAKKNGVWDPKGKTPQNTVSSTLSEFVKSSNAILRIKPGTYVMNDQNTSSLDIEIKKKKQRRLKKMKEAKKLNNSNKRKKKKFTKF
jgi:hypothetical protein